MYMKRILLYIIIILLILSLYNDFQKNSVNVNNDFDVNPQPKGLIVQVKPGDTILSIAEAINGSEKIHNIGVEKILDDFNTMNTSVNQNKLLSGKYYVFPIYE